MKLTSTSGSKTASHHDRSTTMFCCGYAILFYKGFILFLSYILMIHWAKSSCFISSLQRTVYQNFCGWLRWFWAYRKQHFLCLLVSNGENFGPMDHQYVWWKTNKTFDEKNTLPTVKHCGELVMLLVCFPSTGTGKMHRVDEIMDSVKYQEILG